MRSGSKTTAILVTAVTLWGCLASFAGTTQSRGNTATRSTSTRAILETPTNRSAIPNGRYGYILMDAATGEIVSARNEDALFIPASLAKIPTTLVTLSTYGGATRFETRLIANGRVVGGVLKGDLHLVGSGDPSLRTHDVIELLAQMSRAGIRRVTGRFFYHGTALPSVAMIDAMQPTGRHYNPPVSGLNLDYNVKLVNGRRVPVAKPALNTAATLRRLARARGIDLPLPRRSIVTPVGINVATHTSEPVSNIAARMMRRSTNLTAEALGAMSATSLGNKPATLTAAARATTEWLKTESDPLGGVGWDGFHLVNHSGLSTRSRATPRQIAAILRLGFQRFGSTFVDLHKKNTPAGYQAYDLHGKVGSMRFVRGYGGFLSIGGRDFVFTIMANDSRRRGLADAGQPGLRSAAWMNKARRLERDLLSDWIADYWPHTESATLTQTAPVLISRPSSSPARYVRATSVVE